MRSVAVLLLLAAGLAATPAHAQEADASVAGPGFDAHGFTLAALNWAARSPLFHQYPAFGEQGDVFVGGVLEYADQPLVRIYTEDGEQVDRQVVLDNLLALNLSGGVHVMDWLRLDVALPLYFTSTGLDGGQGFDPGDVRLTAMVAPLQPGDDPLTGTGLGVGLFPYLDLPSGTTDDFLGQDGVAGGAKVAVAYGGSNYTAGAEVGAQFNPAIDLDNLQGTDKFTWGAFVGWLPRTDLGFTLEAHASSPFQKNAQPGTDAPAEILLSMKKNTRSGGHFLLGGATALNEGASAAAFRVFLGGGWGTPHEAGPQPIGDRDGDGFLDNVDACPDDPETVNGLRDEDGCPDSLAVVEVRTLFAGEPFPGADLVVTSGEERFERKSSSRPETFQAIPGTAWRGTATYGACITGAGSVTAGESVATMDIALEQKLDAAVRYEVVDEKGRLIPGATATWEKDPTGCVPVGGPITLADGTGRQPIGPGTHTVFVTAPTYSTESATVEIEPGEEQTVRVVLKGTKVRVELEQIVILERVYFEYDKDIIKGESYPLLDEVANTIRSHPELGKIEVAGHTDGDGNELYNQDLSQRRAEAVVRYLIGKGVAADRLVAVGYGESDPVVPNTTTENKAKNRRVQFNILQTQGGGQ